MLVMSNSEFGLKDRSRKVQMYDNHTNMIIMKYEVTKIGERDK